MKVISKNKVLLHNDRDGKVEEYVQIEIIQKEKNNGIYRFETIDSMVLNYGEENESYQPVISRNGQPQIKSYIRTYAEIDAQKVALLQLYPTDLVGSELDDWLLQCGLLFNLENEPIYDAEFIAKP